MDYFNKIRNHPSIFFVTILAILYFLADSWQFNNLSGIVYDNNGNVVEGVTLRIKSTSTTSHSNTKGEFSFPELNWSSNFEITGWKEGFYIAGKTARPWNSEIEIVLQPYQKTDNKNYLWQSPIIKDRSSIENLLLNFGLTLSEAISFNNLFKPFSNSFNLGCNDCHGETIYDQWAVSGHAKGFKNIIFRTMYNGTNVIGEKSPLRRKGFNKDYGSLNLKPADSKSYYGPGYLLDFPNTAGNCAACHLPGAAIDDPYGINPNLISGINSLGSHCDFCHKIESVKLNVNTGLPNENMPGVVSFNFKRPEKETQIFFGPYDDVDAGPDTYSPLMKKSEICAPCHNASFWGVPIYQSFAEWKASPYALDGKTCQHCHMKPDGIVTNFAPGRGGIERDPGTIPTHNMTGASDTVLLQNSVTMKVETNRDNELIDIRVIISNDKTGHNVPTDSPLRNIILLVDVKDQDQTSLIQKRGPVVPIWGGIKKNNLRHYAGEPGKGYAKILEELWTGISPSGAYWNPTKIISDNRLKAFESDTAKFAFSADRYSDVFVQVKLIYRKAFIELMEQKGWEIPDIIMEEETIAIPRMRMIACKNDKSLD